MRSLLTMYSAAAALAAAAPMTDIEPKASVPAGDRDLRRLSKAERDARDTPQEGESRQVRRARERRLAKSQHPASSKGTVG